MELLLDSILGILGMLTILHVAIRQEKIQKNQEKYQKEQKKKDETKADLDRRVDRHLAFLADQRNDGRERLKTLLGLVMEMEAIILKYDHDYIFNIMNNTQKSSPERNELCTNMEKDLKTKISKICSRATSCLAELPSYFQNKSELERLSNRAQDCIYGLTFNMMISKDMMELSRRTNQRKDESPRMTLTDFNDSLNKFSQSLRSIHDYNISLLRGD